MIEKNIDILRKEIKSWEHVTIWKLDRLGYFYSDAIGILKDYKPEDVCKVIKEDYKRLNVDFGYLGKDYVLKKYIIFDNEKVDRERARELFNKHFNQNAR